MPSQFNLQQKVAALKAKSINPAKCSRRTSLYQQILRNSQATVSNQNRKFNLGSGQLFTDPILAADKILIREYADSALFNLNIHDPVFIPPVFKSIQYAKKDSKVHLLDYDVDIKTLKKSLDNLVKNFKDHWFTHEFQAFYYLQQNSSETEICMKQFSNWILNVKITHLMVKELGTDNHLSTISDNDTFIQDCIQKLVLKSPGTALEQALKKVYFYFCFGKNLRF